MCINAMLLTKEVIYDMACPYGNLWLSFWMSNAKKEKYQIVNIVVLRPIAFKCYFSLFVCIPF